MKMRHSIPPDRKHRCFWFIVCVALILFFIALFFIQRAHMLKPQMLQTASNGRHLHVNIRQLQHHSELTVNEPLIDDFDTSTAYFKYLVESQIFSTFALFAGGSTPPAHTADPARFHPENNAWNIVTYNRRFMTDSHATDNTPLLFTKNIHWDPGQRSAALQNTPPFGKRGAIVIMNGGAAYRLNPEYFNASETLFSIETPPTLRILTP